MDNQKYFQNANSINLSIRGCQCENNQQQLIALLKTPSNYPSTVNSFSLDVGFCNPVKFESMKTLASSISVLRQLTHLSLKFDTKTLDLQISTNQQIESLKNEFYKLPLLESLQIRIKNSFTDDAQITIISQMFALQTQLKNFNIELEDSLITSSGLFSFSQLVQSLKNLKQLSISITNNQRATEEKQYLCLWDSIYSLKQLEDLKLCISDCNLQKSVGQESRILKCSQMEQLKTLSFKLLNNNNEKDSTLLINELSCFFKCLPKLEQLSVELGDDCKIDSVFLESITQNALELNYLKFYFGKNSLSSNQQSVENLLRNLTKETQSLLEIQSENDFILIQMKNKDNKIILDLKIAKDSHLQEQTFLRAIFLIQSRFINKMKLNFRRLLGLEDTLKRCDFSNVKELEIEAISDNQNMSVIIQLLECIPKSKLQFLNLKIKDIYSPLNQNLNSNLENQLSLFIALKKINLDLGVQTLQFTLEKLINNLLLNILTKQEFELQINEINLKYDQVLDEYFYFDRFIQTLQSFRGLLFIHLDYVNSKIVINNKINIKFNFSVCKNTINQFVQGILFNSDGFQGMKNCKIKQTTDKFIAVFSRPYKHPNRSKEQQNTDILSENQDDFSKNQLISFINKFSAYSIDGNNLNHVSNFSQFSHLTKIRLNDPSIDIKILTLMVKHMKTVKDLKIIAREINNDIVNSLSSLQNLEKLSLHLLNKDRQYGKDYEIKINEEELIYNETIRYITIKTKGENLTKLNKKKVLYIFKRICKCLVVI